jgi:tetrahydromethanopterin S-methyltransferase subunit G
MPDQVMEILADLRDRMARMETKLDRMHTVEDKADEAHETAREALQSTRSAHKRLDDIENHITWLWKTVIGALITGGIGILFLLISMFLKGGV